MERYNASIIGQAAPSEIQKEMDSLRWRIYELENEDEIDAAEKRVEDKRKRLKEAKATRKKGA
jgi:hypothetical protein